MHAQTCTGFSECYNLLLTYCNTVMSPFHSEAHNAHRGPVLDKEGHLTQLLTPLIACYVESCGLLAFLERHLCCSAFRCLRQGILVFKHNSIS